MNTLKTAWKAVQRDAKQIGAKALHTLWQSFVAVLGVTWAASGLDVSQVTDVASAKRFALAALMAVLAALLSAVKSTVSAISKDPGAYVGVHETIPPTTGVTP